MLLATRSGMSTGPSGEPKPRDRVPDPLADDLMERSLLEATTIRTVEFAGWARSPASPT
jgi:hypothetical protein